MSEENTTTTPPVDHPEFPEIAQACPPGANAPKAKRAKAVAKLYYVTTGLLEGYESCAFTIVAGSEKGFRTKEEMAKFVKTLSAGEYTPISVPSKPITITETKKVSVKGL